MSEIASAYISLIPSFRGGGKAIADELDGAAGGAGERAGKKSGERFGSSFGGALGGLVAPVAAAFAAVGITDFFRDAVGQASGLEEAGNKLTQVFGSAVGSVDAFAASGATALGQSRLAVLDAAASFGIYGKAAGLGDQANAEFSQGLVSLATDMASFSNTTVEEATAALSSGLRGEAEPLRAYGVLLDDATLRAEALKLGLIKTTKDALTPQQKVLAAQSSIYAQTAVQQGDFARTSTGLANQQRILAAQFDTVKQNIGAGLLPALNAAAVASSTTLLPAVIKLTSGLAQAGPAFAEVTGGLRSFITGLAQGSDAAASSGLTGFFQGLGVQAREALSEVPRLLADFGPALGPARAAFADLLPSIAALAPQVVQLVSAFSPLGVVLQALLPVMPKLVGALSQVAAVVAGALVQALPALLQVGTALGGSLAGALAALAPVLAQIIPALGTGLVATISAAAPVVVLLANALSALVTLVAPLAPAILAVVGAVALARTAMATYQGVILTIAAAKQAYAFATYGQTAAETGLLARLAAGTAALQLRAAALLANTRAMLTNLAVNLRWQVLLAQQAATNAASAVAAAATSAAAWVAAAAKTAAAWAAAQARLIASYVATAASAVASAAATATAWVASSAKTVAAVATQSAAFLASRAAMIAGAVATGVLTAAQTALNFVLAANPIGLVVIAIAALVGGLILAYKNSETFRNIVNAAWDAVKAGAAAAFGFITDTILPALVAGFEFVKAGVLAFVDLSVNTFNTFKTGVLVAFALVRAGVQAAIEAVKAFVVSRIVAIVATATQIAAFGAKVVAAFANLRAQAVARLVELVVFVASLPGRLTAAIGNIADKFVTVGGDIIRGIVKGIKGGIASVGAAAREMALGALKAARNALEVKSPSKKFIEVGQFINEGLVIGITSTASDVRSAAEKLADSIFTGFSELASAEVDNFTAANTKSIDALKAQIAALGSVNDQRKRELDRLKGLLRDEGEARSRSTQAEKERISSELDGLSKTEQARKANAGRIEQLQAARDRLDEAAKNSSNAAEDRVRELERNADRESYAYADQVKALEVQVDALQDNAKAFKEAAEASASARAAALVQSIEAQQAVLTALAKDREGVAERLKDATDDLGDAVKLRGDFASSVRSAALSFASLTSIKPEEGRALTARTLTDGLKKSLAAITSFRTNLDKLRKAGISEDLYKQLADAGVQGGSETAAALLAGGKKAVKAVNELQAQVTTASTGLGGDAAITLYQAGVDAATGLVQGLESQSEALAEAARSLAERLASEVRTALGITPITLPPVALPEIPRPRASAAIPPPSSLYGAATQPLNVTVVSQLDGKEVARNQYSYLQVMADQKARATGGQSTGLAGSRR